MSEDMRQPEAHETAQDWMAYIDTEVAAVCRDKGWRRQIRRKWSTREKPASDLDIGDYEWKLIPGPQSSAVAEAPTLEGVPPTSEADSTQFDEGTYFVLSFTRSTGAFLLQHDTHHCGMMDDHMFTRTYTEIDLAGAAWYAKLARTAMSRAEHADRDLPEPIDSFPPAGLLRRFLSALTTTFRPNDFSIT
jgi:hypothetical protein